MNLKTLGLIPKSLRISGSWSQCATKKACRLPMNRCSVAQVANLPYRKLLIGEALERRTASGLATRDTAQRCKAATQVAAGILPAVELGFQPGGRNAPHAAGRMPDRKSTRLNSSHRCISYAVFFLKKKIRTLIERLRSQVDDFGYAGFAKRILELVWG